MYISDEEKEENYQRNITLCPTCRREVFIIEGIMECDYCKTTFTLNQEADAVLEKSPLISTLVRVNAVLLAVFFVLAIILMRFTQTYFAGVVSLALAVGSIALWILLSAVEAIMMRYIEFNFRIFNIGPYHYEHEPAKFILGVIGRAMIFFFFVSIIGTIFVAIFGEWFGITF